MLEQTVVHLIRQHVDATTFSASLIHTPTMQELASVRRFLDGLCSGSNDDSASAAPLLRLIRRVDISPGSVSILLDRNAFAACLSMGPDRIREDALRILAPFRLRRRGVETKLVLGNPTKSVDRTLLRNIANALSWLDRIKADKTYEEIATEDAFPTDRVRKAIRYVDSSLYCTVWRSHLLRLLRKASLDEFEVWPIRIPIFALSSGAISALSVFSLSARSSAKTGTISAKIAPSCTLRTCFALFLIVSSQEPEAPLEPPQR